MPADWKDPIVIKPDALRIYRHRHVCGMQEWS